MNINPTSPQGPRPGDSAPLEGQRAAETRSPSNAAAPEKAPARQPGDAVDVSSEAKALAGESKGRRPSSLSAERLKEIGERLASGHYDQPEVIDTVARRLAADPNFQAGDER